jgi:O-methyltransferase
VIQKASIRYIIRVLRNFSGNRLERAFFWAPSIQKVIRRRRWNQAAYSRGALLVDVDQLRGRLREALFYLSGTAKELVGDYLEFGVFQGTSMICMWGLLKELELEHVRLFGFDSFEGMPDLARTDDGGHWKPGEFAAPYKLVKERLAEAGVPERRAVLIKGWFSDTLNKETAASHGIAKAGVIMVDADLYTSSKQALDFCAPLIQQEAVLLMDDWYANGGAFIERNMGQPRALKEFLAENPQFQKTDIGPYTFFDRLAGHVFILKRACMAMVAAMMLLAGSGVSPLEVQMANDEVEKEEHRHTKLARGLVPAVS